MSRKEMDSRNCEDIKLLVLYTQSNRHSLVVWKRAYSITVHFHCQSESKRVRREAELANFVKSVLMKPAIGFISHNT